jgi:hypothetical protein
MQKYQKQKISSISEPKYSIYTKNIAENMSKGKKSSEGYYFTNAIK